MDFCLFVCLAEMARNSEQMFPQGSKMQNVTNSENLLDLLGEVNLKSATTYLISTENSLC